jgi:hypothetical protein
VFEVKGGCHCGNIVMHMELPRAAGTYRPRACDCDFCRKHGAAYVSDPHGAVRILIKDEHGSGRYRQGSELADFLHCRNCGVLVAALYENAGRLYAAVNATAVAPAVEFAEQIPISPKTLSGAEKTQRWQDHWFSNVSLVSA